MEAETRPTDKPELTVLVLAPIGRDARLTCDVLQSAGIAARPCLSLQDLCRAVEDQALGAVIVAEEAVREQCANQIVRTITTQPSWSDVPILILTGRADAAGRSDSTVADSFRPLGHVTLLERPVRIATLISATRTALRSRMRQYEVRDHLEMLRRADQAIRQTNDQLQIARDEALEASRVKSRFLANMSHELRTPLTAIIGYAEMIREEGEELGNERLVADVRHILLASQHLLGLINDVLDLSKIEAGRMSVVLEPFDVEETIRSVVNVVTPLIRQNGNELVLTIPCGLGILVSDEAKVRQCLLNLLSNAAKFTENGRVELRVVRSRVDGTGVVTFLVSDTGIGIASEDQKKLFTEFMQLDSSPTRRHDGTGLGLALTRRFCELMGGSLSVESTPGHGSTFCMRLPVRSQPSDELKPERSHPAFMERGSNGPSSQNGSKNTDASGHEAGASARR